MIGRRSFMSMIGLAPIAATVGPEVSQGSKNTLSSVLGYGLDATPDIASALDRRARDASLRYKRRKWETENGFYRSERKFYSPCENIASRKATSPAIKAILQDEHTKRQELERALFDRRNAVARALAPPWVQSLWEKTRDYD